MTPAQDLVVVGASVPRVDGVDKVTGRARYTVDVSVPGMLEAKVLRSERPHARIVSIDASRAERLPGVVAVLTRDDVRDIDPYFGHCVRDRPLIAIDRVRYVGEPVAVVAAEDAHTAEAALELIEVEYDELPVMATADAALADGAVAIHPVRGGEGAFHDLSGLGSDARANVCHREYFEEGDVERGLAESDRVFEDTFTFPMVYHYAMEPFAAVAEVGSSGITIWSSCAHPFITREELGRIFGLPLSRVRVIVPYVGGAYGSKSYTKIEPLAVAIARKANRPVRLEQSIADSMLTNRRHSARVRVKTGVRADGTLVARDATVWLDTGGYADNGPRVARRAATRILGPYRIPHCRIEVLAVYTNTCPAGSFRSIGGPQSIWALESHTDMMAEAMGMDALAFRRRNLLARGEAVRPGVAPMDADLVGDLDRVVASMRDGAPTGEGSGTGTGYAVGVADSGAGPGSVALIRMIADGDFILMAGSTEVGQGVRTVLCQIAAEELAVPLERVTMGGTDTSTTPFDRSTGASRSTTVMGTAVRAAAAELRCQLLAIGAELFEVALGEVTVERGELVAGGRRMTYAKALHAHFGVRGGELLGRGYCRVGGGLPTAKPLFWETGVAGARVRVDPETGRITLLRLASLADVGKAINPVQCEGQDEGAVMMGIGHALVEELVYEDGQPLNPNLVDYRVPSFEDLPDEFETILVENGDGPGPYGAKGMGEGGIVSPAPAIANALASATGVRIKELPLTPERVWWALRERDS